MTLQAETIQIIRDAQADSIKAKQLLKSQLDLIYTHNWFNIWVPQNYGGTGHSFIEGLQLLEELAYYDGGLAWTITLCSGANMFAGFIEPDTAKEVFGQSNVCFGGSGRANGKAVWDGEAYVLSGMWSFATGSPHLSHFTLNAPIYDAEEARLDVDGKPVVYSFFVPRDQVLVHYDWNTFGLECTASHSFSLDKVRLDANHAFVLSPDKRHCDTALYRIPFMPFAELTLLVNYLGMYRRFLDLSEKYFFAKSKDTFWAEKYSKSRFRKLDELQQQWSNYHAFVQETAADLWTNAQEKTISADELYLSELSNQCKDIVENIRAQVPVIMPLLGIQAASLDNELNIVFRNIFTATQHSLLNLR